MTKYIFEEQESGKLYVALSRAGLPHRTKVMFINIKETQDPIEDNDGNFTTNIFYNEVLN